MGAWGTWARRGETGGRAGTQLWPVAHLAPRVQVPHRLLTLTLLPGLELCLLCGPRPPLSQLDPQVNSAHVLLPPIIPPTRASRPRALCSVPQLPHRPPPFRAVLPPPSPRLGSPFAPLPCVHPQSPCLPPCGLLPSSVVPLTSPWPGSSWTAGGSPHWTPCGPACRWDPALCRLTSPCTPTSWGRARMEGGVGGSWGPHSFLPVTARPSPQAAAPPFGAEALPLHRGACSGER